MTDQPTTPKKWLQKKQKEHPGKIRIVTKENGGKADALNTGFSLAQYDVVIAMDGDTIFMKDTISKLARHFPIHKWWSCRKSMC